MRGVLYILTNPAFPHLVKVGVSRNSPEARAAQISRATGVPTPFQIAAYFNVGNIWEAEREAHAALASCRTSQNREFFQCSTYYAVDVIRRLCLREPTRGNSTVAYHKSDAQRIEDSILRARVRALYKKRPAV